MEHIDNAFILLKREPDFEELLLLRNYLNYINGKDDILKYELEKHSYNLVAPLSDDILLPAAKFRLRLSGEVNTVLIIAEEIINSFEGHFYLKEKHFKYVLHPFAKTFSNFILENEEYSYFESYAFEYNYKQFKIPGKRIYFTLSNYINKPIFNCYPN